MRTGRTLVATVVGLCGLTVGPALAGQTQTNVTRSEDPGPPLLVTGVLLPPSVLQPEERDVRELSVDEAVALALEQNLDLRVERLNPLIQDLSIAEARSVYTPTLSTTVLTNNRSRPSTSIFDGSESTISDRLFSDSVDIAQEVPWAGGRYSVNWDGSHSSTNSGFTSFDPVLQSNLRLNYTQPLLRNLGIDAPRLQIAITRLNRDMSDIQLRRTVVRTQRRVRYAYWGLVFARSFLEVQRQSLELAEESLRNNRTRVEVGTMAPLDIVEAESEVARNEEAVIIAEADLDRAEDQLRTLIFDPDVPDFWSIRIQPSDEPILRARTIDIDAAVKNAQDNRTDLDTLDKDIENTDTNIRYFRNQRLPDVNLQVDYALSGIGGTELLRGQGFLGPITGTEQTSFGSVLGDIFSNDFPNWTVGVTVAYPLGTSSATVSLERARLERTQADVTRRSLETQSPMRSATQAATSPPTCNGSRLPSRHGNWPNAGSRRNSAGSRWDCPRASSCSRPSATWPRPGAASSKRSSTTRGPSSTSTRCRTSRWAAPCRNWTGLVYT